MEKASKFPLIKALPKTAYKIKAISKILGMGLISSSAIICSPFLFKSIFSTK
jgi:hypothetical protein